MNIQRNIFIVLSILCLNSTVTSLFAQQIQNKSSFEESIDAPFKVMERKLANGLTVLMAPSKESPTIRTSIMIKAGSQQEPENTTGLAHYLEHLLFKGTDQLGALNFAKEKPLLDEIEAQFEIYRKTTDSLKRRQIYSLIDSLSYKASTYAQSSEFSDILIKMGAFFVNAFTNVNRTGYINKIPSNQLEKWIRLEAERFRNPQFRTFHTELEAVYEEMNIFQDDAYNMTQLELLKTLFPLGYGGYKHPIGEIEHLKNPSITEIKQFYRDYYVPNNMAIILVGDFDPDQTMALLASTFGKMKSGKVPKIQKPKNQKLKSPIEQSITTSGPNLVYIGYEFDGYGSEEAILMEFIEMLMFNGNAGLLDLHINNKQKTKSISTFPIFYQDYSAHIIYAEPKEGQRLTEVRDLILEQFDRLKKGDFPDWLVEATRNELSKRYMQSTSSERGKTDLLMNAFINEISLADNFEIIHQLNAVTKADIIAFAQKHYSDNYAIVYHKNGTNINKIKKPVITGLSKNANQQSDFRKQLELSSASFEIDYQALDFEKDISTVDLAGGAKLYHVKNVDNSLFHMRIVLNIPQSNKFSPLLKNYLEKAATEYKTRNKVDEELFKLGSQLNLFSDLYSLTIAISGLSENYEKSLDILSDLLHKVKADTELLASISSSLISKNHEAQTTIWGKKQQAFHYIRYGRENALRYIISEEELGEVGSAELVHQIQHIFNEHYEVYYYGVDAPAKVRKAINSKLIVDQKITHSTEPKVFPFVPATKNKVYLVDHKSNKAELFFIAKLKGYDQDLEYMSIIFNSYFSGLIFKELRERRGLAYTAYSRLAIPTFAKRNFLFYPIVNTQTDKVAESSILAKNLIRDLPMDEEVYLEVRNRFLQTWKADRAAKSTKLDWFQRAKMRGIKEDQYARNIRLLEKSTFEDFKRFYSSWIKDALVETLIVGDLEGIAQDQLGPLGEIEVLTTEKLFGN